MTILFAAAAAVCSATLPAGLDIPLETVAPLSSKSSVKGDMVTLRISADVILDGVVVIRKGSDATGQISNAQAKGAMGMSGRITVSPLYLRIDGDVVRLIGGSSARVGTNAATVAGVWLFAGVTGRSATIPPGRLVPASVYRAVTVRVPGC